MADLPGAGDAANRPAFTFKGPPTLPIHVSQPAHAPAGQLRLSGPSEKLDAGHWPVRGDLAHVALAGRCFVPHYAVPMAHVLTSATALQRGPEGDSMAELAAGTGFAVLDIAGGWCWGQVSESGASTGLVGYLPQAALAPVGP